MFLEETVSVKEFALMLDSRLGKNDLPLKYFSARRIIERFGGFRVVGNGNPNYKTRVITRQRAEEIIAFLTFPPFNGRRRP